MSLFKIRAVDNLNEPKSILARAGTLKVCGHNIDTPFNMPTSSDIKKLEELRKNVEYLKNLKFPQKICEINRFFSEKKIPDVLNNRSVAERIANNVGNECAKTNFSMFRPVISRDVEITDKLNSIITEIQIKAETDFMLTHDRKFNASVADFDSRIQETTDYIESSHDRKKYIAVLPVIRMDMPQDLFEQKINVAIDNGFEGIVFVHAPYYIALKKYMHIKKIAENKEIWFHLAGCNKTWHKNKKTSLPHILQLFGFDTFSIKPKRAFGKPPQFKFHRFNQKTWGITNQTEWSKCACPIDKGIENSDEWISNFNGIEMASPALACHNIISGYNEFVNSGEAVIFRALREYIGERKYAREAMLNIFKKYLNQVTLEKWIKQV